MTDVAACRLRIAATLYINIIIRLYVTFYFGGDLGGIDISRRAVRIGDYRS